MGEQRSRKKEQEPSLAAHSEQLKTKHADRKTVKRGSNGRARRVYCKLAKGGAGGGESRAGEEKVGGQEGAGRGGPKKRGGPGQEAKADKSGKIKGTRAGGVENGHKKRAECFGS